MCRHRYSIKDPLTTKKEIKSQQCKPWLKCTVVQDQEPMQKVADKIKQKSCTDRNTLFDVSRYLGA